MASRTEILKYVAVPLR